MAVVKVPEVPAHRMFTCDKCKTQQENFAITYIPTGWNEISGYNSDADSTMYKYHLCPKCSRDLIFGFLK